MKIECGDPDVFLEEYSLEERRKSTFSKDHVRFNKFMKEMNYVLCEKEEFESVEVFATFLNIV